MAFGRFLALAAMAAVAALFAVDHPCGRCYDPTRRADARSVQRDDGDSRARRRGGVKAATCHAGATRGSTRRRPRGAGDGRRATLRRGRLAVQFYLGPAPATVRYGSGTVSVDARRGSWWWKTGRTGFARPGRRSTWAADTADGLPAGSWQLSDDAVFSRGTR